MSARRIVVSALAVCLMAGCSTVIVRDEPRSVSVESDAEIETAPLVEALIENVRFTRVQALDATWKDKNFTAEVVLKGDGESMTIVILAPQMRLATITLTRPHRIRCERAPRIPDAFAPEFAVVDVAFALLPTAALSDALGSAFTVKDDGRRRELLCGGRVVRMLERRAGGEVFFVNPLAGYECVIVTMEETP